MSEDYPNRNRRLDKLSYKEKTSLLFDLIHAFKLANTPAQTASLMQDLLTANEISNLSKRLRIAKLLIEGKTYRQIMDELHCSLGTVSKVKSWLDQGGDGLKSIINKLPKKYDMPKNLPKKPLEFQLPQMIIASTQAFVSKKQSKVTEMLTSKMRSKKFSDKKHHRLYKDHYKNKHE